MHSSRSDMSIALRSRSQRKIPTHPSYADCLCLSPGAIAQLQIPDAGQQVCGAPGQYLLLDRHPDRHSGGKMRTSRPQRSPSLEAIKRFGSLGCETPRLAGVFQRMLPAEQPRQPFV
jgi:hypothetical protein